MAIRQVLLPPMSRARIRGQHGCRFLWTTRRPAKKQTEDRKRALKAASQAAGLFQRSSGSKVSLPAGTALGASGKIVKLPIPAKTPSERGGTSSATVAGTDQAHCGANAAAEQHNTSAITGNAEPQPDAEVRVQARARAYVCA